MNNGQYVDGEDDYLKGQNLTTNKNVPRVNEEDEDSEQAKAEVNKLLLANAAKFEKEAEEFDSDDN